MKGRGVGTKMVKFCEGKARERGFSEVCLWVFEKNADGRAFYEKQGYRPDGTVKYIDIFGINEIRYSKHISDKRIKDGTRMSTRGITEYLGAEFAEFLSKQIRLTPVADAFGDRTTLGRDYPAANQHEIQKLHVLGWFCAEKNEHRTAKDVYDHIHDPAMYLWIAETVGFDEETVRKAAYEAGGRYLVKDGERIEVTTQAKIIRDIIPWADIFQKLIRLTTNH